MKRAIGKRALLLIPMLLLSCGIALTAAAERPAWRVEELRLERDGQRLWGALYLPEDASFPIPLAILSHGLGSNHHIMEPYAERFAERGIAACVFDYIGGSEESLSDGVMTQMSVLTEATDLNVVLDHFLADDRISEDAIFLFGGSQGGFISAYVAGNRPGDVEGLIALYPAFNLQDICRNRASDGIPDATRIGEHTVGGIYLEDMLTFDIYEVMRRYTGPALLFHGDADEYVPLDYSYRAVDALPDAKLVVVEGAGHGFAGKDLARVAEASTRFIEMILNAAGSGTDQAA